MMSFWCILTQYLTSSKHEQALSHGFYGSIAKRSLQKQCKNYQEIQGQTKEGGGAPLVIPCSRVRVSRLVSEDVDRRLLVFS